MNETVCDTVRLPPVARSASTSGRDDDSGDEAMNVGVADDDSDGALPFPKLT
jgi:hypothetical protein